MRWLKKEDFIITGSGFEHSKKLLFVVVVSALVFIGSFSLCYSMLRLIVEGIKSGRF